VTVSGLDLAVFPLCRLRFAKPEGMVAAAVSFMPVILAD